MIITPESVNTLTQLVLNRITSHFTMLLVYGFMALQLFAWTADFFQWKWDDSDGARTRSGLTTFTDCKTGVQYISVGQSAPTVRLDEAGQPVKDLSNCF